MSAAAQTASFRHDPDGAWYHRLMARQFGTVRPDERKGKRYGWFIDCYIDGKRYRLRGAITRGGKTIRFHDELAAQEALDDIKSDIRRGQTPLQAISDFLPTGAPEHHFQRHYRRFLAAKQRQGHQGQGDRRKQLSAKRLEELRGHERRGHLEPLLRLSIQTLGYGDLEDWCDWLFTQHLSAGSVHHVVADVRTCLRWLHKRGDITGVPEMPAVTVPEHAAKIPTPERQKRLLEAIPWELRGLFLARGYMGLRPSEAARANVEDYDFERDLLTVYRKSGNVSYLPADAEVARWIHEFVLPPPALRDTSKPSVPLFPNPNAYNEDKRWLKSSADRAMKAAMKQTGLYFRPNEALRHAFATGAVNRGVPLDRTGAYLGHSDLRTTKRYAKMAPAGLRGVVPHGGDNEA